MKTLALASALLLAPSFALAQTYAYVTVDGEVATIEAMTPDQAITIAPDRHENSGVLHVDEPADAAVVGEEVPVDQSMTTSPQ